MYADRTEAVDLARAAERKRRERTEARTEEIERLRRRRATIRANLARLLSETPLPRPCTPAPEREGWAVVIAETVEAWDLPDSHRGDFAKADTSKMRAAGYREQVANQVGRCVAGIPAADTTA